MSTLTPIPIRPELDAAGMPSRMRTLKVDERGYPVPWFVAWENGRPEFRTIDPRTWIRAIREKRCWICGESLGRWHTFVIGPMCGLNRTTAEPPNHTECATWSVRNCPFLTRPHMTRRENDLPADCTAPAGEMNPRNPGVTLLWTTTTFRVFNAGNGQLIKIGDPRAVAWYREGRPATRAEVETSVNTGVPFLLEAIAKEPTEAARKEARQEFDQRLNDLRALYPQ